MYKKHIFSLLTHITIEPGIIFTSQIKKMKLTEIKEHHRRDGGAGIQNHSCLFPKLLVFSQI